MTGTRIAIGICTFRRPGIAATLASLGALRWPEGMSGLVIVADNDETPSARETVHAAAKGLSLPVCYLHAPARNISVARNAILEAAEARGIERLAFLDDDEMVEPGWIAALTEALARTGTEAVLGPVRAEHGAEAPAWMRESAIHDTRPTFLSDGSIKSGYSCNVLMDLTAPALEGLRFDPARGRSGGEDTAFFEAMLRRGGRLGFAPDALVRETVPTDRARLGWLLRRRFRMGQTHASLIAGPGRAQRAKQALVALSKVAACSGMALAAVHDPLRRNNALLRGALHVGTLSALFGARPITIYGGTGPAHSTFDSKTDSYLVSRSRT
ncbi:glycosyltransferase [Cereibacter sphaeroides]|uniref:glycosyltransferase n=1 Tax=Cereibacter sphaeroides TaxID=1063 RepID=UPI000E5A5317|nr:glycosyltransferase family 2 protein [Cereibacter sphaeroides]RHZ93758.1 glycosyltransferase [Cereibacter sphaeroides]